jgi:hypothetical protein
MSRFSTLNVLINSYGAGTKRFDFFQEPETFSDDGINTDDAGFEPSQICLEAILSFASQYDVLKSESSEMIELNLN